MVPNPLSENDENEKSAKTEDNTPQQTTRPHMKSDTGNKVDSNSVSQLLHSTDAHDKVPTQQKVR